ncbi:MAG: DUF6456 domain-containing protein [Parvibaculales bacterium]
MTNDEEKLFLKMARRLSEPQAFLLLLENSGDFGVMVRRNKWRKPVIRLPAETVQGFIKNDWLLASGTRDGFFVLSEAGVKCYRRQTELQGFLAQHQEMEMAANGTLLNVDVSPVNWLRRHNRQGKVFFSETELAAAERLCADHEASLAVNNMTPDLSRQGIRSRVVEGYNVTDRALDASRRVDRALDYVGEDLDEILKLTCLNMLGLEKAERRLGWPRRSGKLVLKIALRRLNRFYASSAA